MTRPSWTISASRRPPECRASRYSDSGAAGVPLGGCRRIGPAINYHLNYGLIWRHFGRLAWGLGTSLELAVISVAIGFAFGLVLALALHVGGRLSRAALPALESCTRYARLIHPFLL